MNYSAIRVLRKLSFDEDVKILYSNICTGLAELDPPWGLRGVDVLPLKGGKPSWPDYGITYRLRGNAKSLEMRIYGRNRKQDADDLKYINDQILVEFSATRKGQDLPYIFDQVIPLYVRIFGAFTATVEDVTVLGRYGEWFRSLSQEQAAAFQASDRSPRNTCLHIWQVNYWAREQCNNYFGLTPEQVVAALKDRVARADILEDGAYIVASYAPMSPDEVEALTPALMPLLMQRR